MSIFKSIVTAFRGKGTELGEAFVDANADTILSQQVRDVETEIKNSVLQVASLDAKRKVVEAEVKALLKKKADAKSAATQLLENDKEAEAMAILDAVESEVTPSLTAKEKQLKMMVDSLVKLKSSLDRAKKNKVDFEARVAIAKTQMQVNKMTKTASASTISNESASAQMKATLSRFEQKSVEDAHKLDSLEEMEKDSTSLDALISSAPAKKLTAAERLAAM